MTNLAALCANRCESLPVLKPGIIFDPITHMPTECPCLGTGYENPWVAPLLAECPIDIFLLADGHIWVNQANQHSYACQCQATRKRYPQLWRWDGSGWIPDITTAGLWDVAGDIGMSAVVDKLPYDMLYDWITLLTEEQRMEALAKSIVATEA